MTSHIDDIKACGQSRWSDFGLMSMGILRYSSAKEKFTLEDVQQIFARVNDMKRNISWSSTLTEFLDTLKLAHAHSFDI